MILEGGRYFDGTFRIVSGDVEVENGRIVRVGRDLPKDGREVVEVPGRLIAPGFIDVHNHGCGGACVGDGTREAIDTMARFLLDHGVTSFLPTTDTADPTIIESGLRAARACAEQPIPDGARVMGVHMEGPFISAGKKGAQNESAIVAPDFELFCRYNELAGGLVRLVVVAPEQPGGYEFAQQASRVCTVSIAHTMATYEEAKRSFDCGVTHATHLFNAMNGLHHRKPGVVGAVLEDPRVRGELICDGHHIHPAVLRTAFQVLGDRALIVSDSVRASGLPEGEITDLSGQTIYVKDGKATLADGTLAGSVTNVYDEVKNLVRFGIPLEQAVRSASLIPARAVGLDGEIGSIEAGKRADLVLLDDELQIEQVYLEGRAVR